MEQGWLPPRRRLGGVGPDLHCHNPGCPRLGHQVRVIVFPAAVSGGAEGLAGVPAGEEVERSELGAREVLDVGDAGDIGPVLGEHFLAVVVEFDLSDACVTCALESKVYPSDSGEEADERHGMLSGRLSAGLSP